MKYLLGLVSSGAVFVSAAGTAFAGNWTVQPQMTDNGAAAGVILLLAIGAVVMLGGGAGASASQPRKDKEADEE
jgi:hypothetical protein